ncbi:hypothetical protein BU15DRAFT_68618 [Melanogaster broomeanus]|nr:hypothetical protein BU15DRAFT_68618 [Melanogaster broomeanus]
MAGCFVNDSNTWHGVPDPFLTTKEMHALRLVPGHDWASIASEFIRFNITNTPSTTPLLTENYLNNPLAITKISLVCHTFFVFFLGHGCEPNAEKAERELEVVAPNTHLRDNPLPIGPSCPIASSHLICLHSISSSTSQPTEQRPSLWRMLEWPYHQLPLSYIWATLTGDQILMQAPIATNIPGLNIHDFYQQTLPSEDTFDEEVETFQEVWNTLQEKLTCSLICKALVGEDPTMYCKMTDRILTDEGHKAFITEQDEGIITASNNESIMGKYCCPLLRDYTACCPDTSCGVALLTPPA